MAARSSISYLGRTSQVAQDLPIGLLTVAITVQPIMNRETVGIGCCNAYWFHMILEFCTVITDPGSPNPYQRNLGNSRTVHLQSVEAQFSIVI